MDNITTISYVNDIIEYMKDKGLTYREGIHLADSVKYVLSDVALFKKIEVAENTPVTTTY